MRAVHAVREAKWRLQAEGRGEALRNVATSASDADLAPLLSRLAVGGFSLDPEESGGWQCRPAEPPASVHRDAALQRVALHI